MLDTATASGCSATATWSLVSMSASCRARRTRVWPAGQRRFSSGRGDRYVPGEGIPGLPERSCPMSRHELVAAPPPRALRHPAEMPFFVFMVVLNVVVVVAILRAAC